MPETVEPRIITIKRVLSKKRVLRRRVIDGHVPSQHEDETPAEAIVRLEAVIDARENSLALRDALIREQRDEIAALKSQLKGVRSTLTHLRKASAELVRYATEVVIEKLPAHMQEPLRERYRKVDSLIWGWQRWL
jgi:hypothetical protein